MAGKWHLGERPPYWPRSRGFDRYFGLISGANSFFEVDPGRQMALDDDPWTPPAAGYYSTDAYTDFAVDRIVENKKLTPNQPFLLYLAHQAPHSPLMALPEDIARYRGRYDKGWDVLRAERNARQRQLGIIDQRHEITPRPEGIPAWIDVPETAKASWIGRMEVYAAMIDRVDQGIGRVLAALEQTGQRENTLVIFLSDNGATTEGGPTAGMGGGRGPTAGEEVAPHAPMGSRDSRINELEPWASVSNTPYRLYKNFLHEGGIKTGMVATWPRGIRRSDVMTDQVGHVVDVMPTILQVAGIRYPGSRAGTTLRPLRGQSLVPAFQGQTVARTAPLFWAYGGRIAVREGDWKLVYNQLGPKPHLELYDLAADPTEHHDLSARYPDRAAQLRRDWQVWADKAGAREAASIHALPR